MIIIIKKSVCLLFVCVGWLGLTMEHDKNNFGMMNNPTHYTHARLSSSISTKHGHDDKYNAINNI